MEAHFHYALITFLMMKNPQKLFKSNATHATQNPEASVVQLQHHQTYFCLHPIK